MMLNRADYKCLIVLKLPGSDVYGGKVSAARGGKGGRGGWNNFMRGGPGMSRQ